MPLPPLVRFGQIAQSAPCNAVFFADDVIFASAMAEDVTPENFASALAELLVRFFLSRDEKFRPLLDDVFGKEALDSFIDLCDKLLSNVPVGKPCLLLLERIGSHPRNACVGQVVQARFVTLLNAHGLIPVFREDSDQGYFLPFTLEGLDQGADGEVVDCRGTTLEAWSAAIRALPDVGQGTKRYRVHVAIDAGCGDDCANTIFTTGRSLMLPVQMAIWRESHKLPRYNPFHLVATGLFGPDGRLGFVDTEAKLAAAEKCLYDCSFLYPASAGTVQSGCSQPLPAGEDWKSTFERIREIAEEKFVNDVVYTLSRLGSSEFKAEMDVRRYGNWDGMVRRLANMLGQISKRREPEKYLSCLMMLSMANCHAARTAAALDWNRKARDFAQGVSGFKRQLFRLRVELLVMLTDQEEFETLFAQASDLLADIDAFSRGELAASVSDDLEMRLQGTLGQAYAYAALAGIEGGDSDRAKTCFEHASQAAIRRLQAHEDSERDVCAADVAHDANYLYLWDVLFSPGHAADTRHEAEVADVEIRDEKARRKNHVFLMRQLGLEWYRGLLRGDTAQALEAYRADRPLFDEMIADPDVPFWIRALGLKYRGSIRAAAGQADDARRDFVRALELLRRGEGDAVIAKMAMTVRAEAVRSMRAFGDLANDTESMRREGIEYFVSDAACSMINLPWRAFLENPGETPFPGLAYWY